MSTNPAQARPSFFIRLFWHARQRRLRTAWRILLTFVSFVILSLLMELALGLVGIPLLRWLGILLVSILTVTFAARILDRRHPASLGLQFDGDWWTDLAFGLLLGAILMTAIFLVQWAAGWVIIRNLWHTPLEQPFGLAFLEPVLIFLCIGIYEELLFRGYLLRNLAEGFNHHLIGSARGGLWLALALVSILFGIAHAGNPNATLISVLNITIAGFVIGLGYALTGRLGLSIGFHITWNLVQGNLFGFPVSGARLSRTTVLQIEQNGPALWTGGAFGPEGGLLALLALIWMGFLTVLWTKRRYGRAHLQTSLAQPPREDDDEID